MKFILIADLHFGSVPEGLADELAGELSTHAPGVIVVAGDLTLRARAKEFTQAQEWLRKLAPPVLILPGNHDLPYWNLYQRFADPLHLFRQAFEASLMPSFQHGNGFVLGFNTTRSWQPHLRWQEGVARKRDIIAAQAALKSAPEGAFKVVAAHHPFLKVDGRPRVRPVGRARAALGAFVEGGIDMILSGHTHQSFAMEVEQHGRSIIAIGAPTALSWRMRGEANGYWVVSVERDMVHAELHLRQNGRFEPVAERHFNRQPRQ